MVGNGNGRVSPFDGAPDQVFGGRQGIERRHVRMQMEFNALFSGIVLALDFLHGDQVAHRDGELVREVVIHAFAAQFDIHADLDLFDLLHDRIPLFLSDWMLIKIGLLTSESGPAVAHEDLAENRRGIVCDGKGDKQHFAALEFLGFKLEDIALDNDEPTFGIEPFHLHGMVCNGASHDRLADGVVGHLRHCRIPRLFRLLRRARTHGAGLVLTGFPGDLLFGGRRMIQLMDGVEML